MNNETAGSLRTEGAAALQLMQQALQLLDRCPGAAVSAPHLDLAICRLQEAIESDMIRAREEGG